MKKVYRVNIYKTDCEGKATYIEAEYVRTENITEYIEKKMTEIENTPYWWMDHHKAWEPEYEGRPRVKAEEIEIKEV